MCVETATSMSTPLTPTIFSTCLGPVSVPDTETCEPSASRAADRQHVAEVLADRVGDQPDLDAALGGQHRRVDVGDRLLDHVAEDALERGELEHRDVVLGDLAAHLDVELRSALPGERREDPAELLHERDPGADLLGDDAAGDVDRVGHELAGEGQAHRPGHRDAGLLLRLVGRGAEVRGDDDVLEGEERRVGGRLVGEDVEPGAGDPALLERVVERVLVDDAAAGRVDDAHGRLDLERLLADQADGLRGLGQVDGDEVGLGEQLVEADQPDAELAARRP